MEQGIIVLLAILLCFFVILYFLQQRGIKSIRKMLSEVNHNESNSRLLISHPDKHLEELVLEINKVIDKKQISEVESKKMEVEIRQAIANMSHDLRTPLTSIVGYMEFIDDENLPFEEKKDYINVVKKRAQSLQSLITSFYDLARLEANEYKFDVKETRLDEVLADILSSYYREFNELGIEPMVKIDEKTPGIRADERAVRRIFSNILDNILRYGNEPVTILLAMEGNYISTKFTNMSYDLTKADSEQIFQRFFTADRTRGGKGTGLGLAITKELVEQMGHEISACLKGNELTILLKWKLS
ncbi:HAMP domain-containing histidine kinase [Alkalicella caledoniensis]|uniref:histidine kinase n=1 Tax=Alkalicella caledoniensis TaxID=2731377 RepID=A0A7G9W9T3_ALKCA|nr:HAMP domain-containing sensor histidine kinase [Alkalicella caledoniensis]QNO15445.1 HAMP domain-containing histidine kinase [Alkalicella caledoniensis]